MREPLVISLHICTCAEMYVVWPSSSQVRSLFLDTIPAHACLHHACSPPLHAWFHQDPFFDPSMTRSYAIFLGWPHLHAPVQRVRELLGQRCLGVSDHQRHPYQGPSLLRPTPIRAPWQCNSACDATWSKHFKQLGSDLHHPQAQPGRPGLHNTGAAVCPTRWHGPGLMSVGHV